MSAIKNFDEFVRMRIAKKQTPNISRAKFLIKEAENSYSNLLVMVEKLKIDESNANLFVKSSYDVLMEMIRAKMLLDGFNASGFGAHEAEVAYMRILGFSEKDVQFADQIRFFRNGIVYYGTILDKEYAEQVVSFAESNYSKLKRMIEFKPKIAIILAGGQGERLKPLTLTTPKPLLPIKGKPIVQHIIENLHKYNINNIILAIGYKADKIKECLGDGKKLGVHIKYCIETQPLGTGGAIKEAAKGIKETFLALNGDNMADFNYDEMLKIHEKNKAKITIALYPVEDVTQYGIAELKGNRIMRFIEKPKKEEAPSNLNNAGAYFIEPEALKILPEGKSSIERDCFEKLSKEGIVYAYKHDGQWFPTDTLEKYHTAEKEWKR